MPQGLTRALLLMAALLLLGAAGAEAQAKKAAAAPAPPAKSEDCLACHSDKDLKRSAVKPGRPASLFVDAKALEASTHGGFDCVQCHQGVPAPHDEKLPPVRCAECHDDVGAALAKAVHGERRAGGPAAGCASCHGTHDVKKAATLGVEACATCHPSQVTAYRESIHGQARKAGDSDAATCVSCHGGRAHSILRASNPDSAVYHLRLPHTCAGCHADSDLARRHGIRAGNVYQMYMDSIHGRALSKSGLLVAANCSDCHGSHTIKAPTDPTSSVNRNNVPATCGTCHAGIRKEYVDSIHGRQVAAGNKAAPVCTDCHSAHQIRRVDAPPWQRGVIEECGTCHRESLRTYRDTFHGKVTELGGDRVAKCADCHGAHGIQPVENPASRVSKQNIVATCRQCHPDATYKFTEFHPHAVAEDRARYPKLYWTWLLMTSLLVGTFAFFGLHTLLWLPRSLVERLRRRRHGGHAEP